MATTFASIFPDKIERMVVDGVVDADAYYGATWDLSIDSDKALSFFCSSCHEAGADKCAFYADSPSEICQNVLGLRDQLRLAPAPVYPDANGTYGIVDYSAFQLYLYNALYHPYPRFVQMAEELAALKKGDASLVNAAITGGAAPNPDALCAVPSDDEKQFNSGPEVIVAVVCSDSAPNGSVKDTLEEAQAYNADVILRGSFSDLMPGFRIGCV